MFRLPGTVLWIPNAHWLWLETMSLPVQISSTSVGKARERTVVKSQRKRSLDESSRLLSALTSSFPRAFRSTDFSFFHRCFPSTPGGHTLRRKHSTLADIC